MPNTIIRASAGSGKTFQLSNQYIDILCRRKDQGNDIDKTINSILASTFTRKAAGEILDKILQRLANSQKRAEIPTHLADFAKLSGVTPLPDESVTQNSLKKTLVELAKNLYRVRINTLDAFFNKIASTFALELNLPPGWTIIEEIDNNRLIREAIRNVIAKESDVLTLINMLQQGEQSRSVTQDLDEITKEFLSVYRETTPRDWNSGTEPPPAWNHQAIQRKELEADELQNALNQLLKAELPLTQKKEPAANYVKVQKRLEAAVTNESWKEILDETIVKNIVAENFRYDKRDIPSSMIESISKLIEQAQSVLFNKLIAQTTATWQLLRRITDVYDTILVRERGFRFDDITYRLNQGFNLLPIKTLSHRMDAGTDHLLLDEFQDTSPIQWRILQPFTQEVDKDNNKTFFCVGDLKQAIYSWRGGVAEIFETVDDFLKKDGAKANKPEMNETRRNSQSVIDTVNEVFFHIENNTAVTKESEDAAKKWKDWFGETKHKTWSNEKGYCVLEEAPVEEKVAAKVGGKTEYVNENEYENEQIDTTTPYWRYTLDRIAELYKKHPNRSIGVLFRNNENIRTILDGLKNRDIEASGEGGVSLTDSAAVQHILSAMTLADHPGDTVARFHLANGLLAQPLAKLIGQDEFNPKNNWQAIKCSNKLRQRLVTEGYGNVVKELADKLSPACDQREWNRLQKLIEFSYRFDDLAKGVRTKSFIDMITAAKAESLTAANIRVMTIHKSKGLEFDIVVLPDLDRKLVGQCPKIVVARENPTDPISFVLRYANQNLQMLLPEKYQNVFSGWTQNQVAESLAILYVAMTRARQELVMIVPEKRRKGTGTFAGVLCAGLQNKGDLQNKNVSEQKTQQIYCAGNENWDDKKKLPEKSKQELLDCDLMREKQKRNRIWESPSSLHQDISDEEQSQSSQQKRNRKNNETIITLDDAFLRGTAIHACFEHGLRKNKWLDHGEMSREELTEIIRLAVMGKKGNIEPNQVIETFLKACQQPKIRNVLSRASYASDEEIEIEHERRFSVRWHENKFLRGAIDRLVIRRRAGNVVGLEVIDYKSDQPETGSNRTVFLTERKTIYTPQMEAYCDALKKLYPGVTDITVKLLFVNLGEVLELSFQ